MGGFAPIREMIYFGQLEAFTKEIHRFHSFYAAKTVDLVSNRDEKDVLRFL